MHQQTETELILALDVPTREEALNFLKTHCVGNLKWVKIGLQLFTAYGPQFVKEVSALGFNIFLDLKLHDIPNTVASAVKSINALPVHMLTLHTCGGPTMLQAAKTAAREDLQLLGVTVLTSFDEAELAAVNVHTTPAAQVTHLANMATHAEAGSLTGLVCSPLEIKTLRQTLGKNIALVTPGIRPKGAAAGDQKRILTPAQAAQAGSSYIVVGRPILKAENPAEAIASIQAELEAG